MYVFELFDNGYVTLRHGKLGLNNMQKAVNLTTPAKNRGEISNNHNPGLWAFLKLAFKITLTKPDIL